MMKTYISILRGINVSGQKLIKMDALKRMYESLGFTNVKHYLQSGNIIFSTESGETDILAERISEQIEKDFGFQVPVLVMTKEELQKIVDENPFAKDAERDLSALYVTFLDGSLDEFDQSAIESVLQNGEAIHFESNAVYLSCPSGYGRTKLSNTFLERKLKLTATTRNWKTTNKLLQLADT